ncbi:MAG TPA: hypothetical protein VND70_04790 [Acidimicrobiales bacterium]|nr:hypothetical protein [Acidimicrobiales bacterium]
MSAPYPAACPRCGHLGAHPVRSAAGGGACEDCDHCWAEQQQRERPPHHS